METQKNALLPFGTIIALGIILAAGIIGFTFYKIKALENTLAVTGSAKTSVVSDTVKWNTQITRAVSISALDTGYTQMASDIAKVKTFLLDAGVPESEITISAVSFYENYSYGQNVAFNQREYILNQYITVSSKDIQKITELSKGVDAVIAEGVIFQTMSLEYYISNLPELRVSLLGQAVADAKARADELATSSGKRVGTLKSASSGVVQVLSPNSTEVADYGSYDTSQIDKEVMVTVKASFTVR
jgi:hypothetical protein